MSLGASGSPPSRARLPRTAASSPLASTWTVAYRTVWFSDRISDPRGQFSSSNSSIVVCFSCPRHVVSPPRPGWQLVVGCLDSVGYIDHQRMGNKSGSRVQPLAPHGPSSFPQHTIGYVCSIMATRCDSSAHSVAAQELTPTAAAVRSDPVLHGPKMAMPQVDFKLLQYPGTILGGDMSIIDSQRTEPSLSSPE